MEHALRGCVGLAIKMVVQVQRDCYGRLVWWMVGERGWLWSYVAAIWAKRCAAAVAVGRVRGLTRFYRNLWLVIGEEKRRQVEATENEVADGYKTGVAATIFLRKWRLNEHAFEM